MLLNDRIPVLPITDAFSGIFMCFQDLELTFGHPESADYSS